MEALQVVKVVKGLSAGWGACSRTIPLSDIRILSHHSNSIAVGSRFGDIIILNATTGSQSAILSEHKLAVTCIAFSSDGTSLVSGSNDQTIKLWDIQTGGIIKTFFGHKCSVLSVSISADSTTIASGYHYEPICLWNIQAGECSHTIQQYGHVMFSPKDPQHLVSISNWKVWQWDTSGCQIRPPFYGSRVAFSSDGAQFVSCFEENITVHNSSSGDIITEFQVDGDFDQWCFSPDNRLVAIAVDKTVHCWDIITSEPRLVETLIDHTKKITSLIFSSPTTLVSASEDDSVKIWQIGAQSTDLPLDDLQSTSLPLVSIKSVSLQSKEGMAITVDLGGVIKVWDISTGVCKTTYQTPDEYYHRGDIQLVNGGLIFVWYVDHGIYVWDVENGELLWEVDEPWDDVEDLRISGDGSRVFGLYKCSIWAWSLWTGELVWKVKIGHKEDPGSLITDGSKVWAHWSPSDYEGWDFGTPGSSAMELSNRSIPSLSRLWDPNQASIKNPATGEFVFQLSGRFANPVCVQCDDSYLVAGYNSGEILILDLTNVH